MTIQEIIRELQNLENSIMEIRDDTQWTTYNEDLLTDAMYSVEEARHALDMFENVES